MFKKTIIAVIGSGPTGSGFINSISQQIKDRKISKKDAANLELHVFDKSSIFGVGLPYDQTMNDHEHLLNVPYKFTFVKSPSWIEDKQVQADIKNKFRSIHDSRLREKLQKRFQIIFDETDYKNGVYAENIRAQSLCDQYYQVIWPRIEKGYLNFESALTFYPRIFYGIYSSTIYDQNKKALEEQGVTFIEHPKTEVISLDETTSSNQYQLAIKSGKSADLPAFDGVVVATGWQAKKQQNISEKHLLDVRPSADFEDKVEEIIARELAERSAENNPSKVIKVAIQGTGLTAIDIARTLLLKIGDGVFQDDDNNLKFIPFDGNNFELHIDMISRGGRTIPSGNSRTLSEEYSIQNRLNEKISELKKAQEGKIYLWQIVRETAAAARDLYAVKYPQIANQIDEFIELLDQNSQNKKAANYGEILKGILSFEEPDPIKRLHNNLTLTSSDTAEELIIFRAIYRQFHATLQSLLKNPQDFPAEEIAFYDTVLLPIHRFYYLTMPQESIKELVAANDAKVLDIVALGDQGAKLEKRSDGKLIFAQNGKKDLAYDLVINAMGNAETLKDVKSPLSLSILEKFVTNKFDLCTEAESAEKMTQIENRFGQYGDRVSSSLTLKNGKIVYDRGSLKLGGCGIILDENDNEVWPGVLFLADRSSVGEINSAFAAGEKGAEYLVKKFLTDKEITPNTSLSQASVDAIVVAEKII